MSKPEFNATEYVRDWADYWRGRALKAEDEHLNWDHLTERSVEGAPLQSPSGQGSTNAMRASLERAADTFADLRKYFAVLGKDAEPWRMAEEDCRAALAADDRDALVYTEADAEALCELAVAAYKKGVALKAQAMCDLRPIEPDQSHRSLK